MLRFEFTNEEIEEIKKKIHFTPRQVRIISYRLDELSLIQMAELESCDVSTISREIKKIRIKIMRVIWQFSEEKKKRSRQFRFLFLWENVNRKEKELV